MCFSILGKFILKFKKGVSSRLWENLLLSVLGRLQCMPCIQFSIIIETREKPHILIYVISKILSNLGEQFLVGDEITGVVLSVRHYSDSLCVWNSNSKNKFVINHISQTLKRVLNLSENVQVEYKAFNQRSQVAGSQANWVSIESLKDKRLPFGIDSRNGFQF